MSVANDVSFFPKLLYHALCSNVAEFSSWILKNQLQCPSQSCSITPKFVYVQWFFGKFLHIFWTIYLSIFWLFFGWFVIILLTIVWTNFLVIYVHIQKFLKNLLDTLLDAIELITSGPLDTSHKFYFQQALQSK